MIKRTAGFTLTEIMTVVLIIGILLALAVPNFIKYRKETQKHACEVNMRSIFSAIEEARMERASDVLSKIKSGKNIDRLVSEHFIPEKVYCPAGNTPYVIEYDSDSDQYCVKCGNRTENHGQYPGQDND